MSFNQFMHQRNIFQSPPDFKELAVLYPDFQKHASVDLTGKIKIDFRDHEAQRVLLKTLLKHYFNLEVEVPEGHLIPAVPQRLNYVLWIEDLLDILPVKNDQVKGLDIGTGASSIIPFLGYKQCSWKFLATESEEENFKYAKENVAKNDLESVINVVKVSPGTSLKEVIQEQDGLYDFCSCNPPFFTDAHDASAKEKAEEDSRSLPFSDMAGLDEEKFCEGGEVAFVNHLIRDSLDLRDKIRVYTVMLGKKRSVKEILKNLKSQSIQCTSTEFCQGRTMRWGVAWTFLDVDLNEVPSVKRAKPKPPLEYTVPRKLTGIKYSVPTIFLRIKELFQEIQVPFTVIAEGKNMCHLWIQASSNTWSHQRRRRREQKHHKKQMGESKDVSMSEKETTTTSETLRTGGETSADGSSAAVKQTSPHEQVSQSDDDLSLVEEAEENKTAGNLSQTSEITMDTSEMPHASDESSKRSREVCDGDDPAPKRLCTGTEERTLLLSADLRLRRNANMVFLQLQTREGNRDLLYQILQYLKNNLK